VQGLLASELAEVSLLTEQNDTDRHWLPVQCFDDARIYLRN
jgi:hypothetical protein